MKRLTDQQLAEAEERAKLSGIPLSQCPTCSSKPDEYGEVTFGKYKLNGVEYDCDCNEQKRLRQHYLYANIPDLYQRLSWDEYEGDPKYRTSVEMYVENWDSFKMHGMGIAFLSQTQGVGKTMLSTFIGRELIKKGESVFFLPHNQMSRALRYNDESVIDKLNTVTVVILDDITAPPHDSLTSIFADNLESVIRNRTNYNGTTILSSNLSEEQLKQQYKRVWSVLEPKVIVQKMDGTDARLSFVGERTANMAVNHEFFPIR